MPSKRDILNALRAVAIGLLMMFVAAVPLGVGAALASAAARTCGVSCPCDEADHIFSAAALKRSDMEAGKWHRQHDGKGGRKSDYTHATAKIRLGIDGTL